MFCPKCKSEYRSGYTICGKCEIPLVHELPPEPASEYVEYEQILATHSPSDIALLKSIIDAEEITYFFQGEYVAPYVYHALPIRLMVKKDQVAKDREILKDIDISFTFGGLNKLVENKDEDE